MAVQVPYRLYAKVWTKIIYNQYKKDLAQILHDLCAYKGVEIIEGHLMPDHVHMLVGIPPKISVSSFIGYLKGKSSLMMFNRHANLKYRYFLPDLGGTKRPEKHRNLLHLYGGGIYVPEPAAVEIAVETVRKWLAETGSNIRVIFNVCKEEDLRIYERILK